MIHVEQQAQALEFARVVVPELTAAAALTGTTLADYAIDAYLEDLADYPPEVVVAALRRTRREVRQLTLASVIERIEQADEHPGADAAWALCPMSEAETALMTEPMRLAFAIAFPLVQRDRVAARMAFKDAYERIVSDHRMRKVPVRWWPTFGTDPGLRASAIAEAVQKGKMSAANARALGYATEEEVPLLEDNRRDELRDRLAHLTKQLKRGE